MSSDSTHSAAMFGLLLLCNVTSTRTADDKNISSPQLGSACRELHRAKVSILHPHVGAETAGKDTVCGCPNMAKMKKTNLKKFQNVFAWCSVLFRLPLLVLKLIEILYNNIRQLQPHRKYTLSRNIGTKSVMLCMEIGINHLCECKQQV